MAESTRPPRRRSSGEAEDQDTDSSVSSQDDDKDQQDSSDNQQDSSNESDPDELHAKTEAMQVSKDDNTRPDTTATLEPLTRADPQDWLGGVESPDVFLSVPNLGVDHIGIKVKNLRAHVELHAQVLDLVEIHVGAQVSVEEVEIDIDNVRIQAKLEVKLDKVEAIVGRVVDLLEHNPEILTNLTGGLGKGLQGALEGGTSGGDKQDLDTSDSIKGESKVTKDEPENDQQDDDQADDQQDGGDQEDSGENA